MYFDSLEAMLRMDGHGAFVWAAYLITAVVVAGMLTLPRRRASRLLRRLRGDLRRAGAPAARPTPAEEA